MAVLHGMPSSFWLSCHAVYIAIKKEQKRRWAGSRAYSCGLYSNTCIDDVI